MGSLEAKTGEDAQGPDCCDWKIMLSKSFALNLKETRWH